MLLALCFAYSLWDRKYRRIWNQSRARGWPKVDGRFDDGEIVTMRKGRSKDIAGYQVWLGYEYEADGEHGGLYTLPTTTQANAEEELKRLANRMISVRVAPGTPKKSVVLDEDISGPI